MGRMRGAGCITVLVVVGAAAGIYYYAAPEPEGVLTEERAEERTSQYIASAVRALPGDSAMDEEALLPAVSDPCKTDEQQVSKSYQVPVGTEEKEAEAAEALVDHWGNRGYTLQEDMRPEEMYVLFRNDDGFRMAVSSSTDEDELSISASSPCFDPEAESAGGPEIPVVSDMWEQVQSAIGGMEQK
ncbi:hypothetical protein O4J56_10535 [Nocardiopsis sp. RSe5-2]|uniref:Secreted protein n=1 Tax=Nocardiopsis endophytica TaxID=3018445 RepID=A0ABT4U2B5_9ACTN|nr:hypothetical protein [Nocardiopsis endophytica]MDA2811073.1 hypothetical protein [Nocardiopsis endophytica]